MSKSTSLKAKLPTRKRVLEPYTIAVRFVRSSNMRAYTYLVKAEVKLTLGQEVIVPTKTEGFISNNVGVVVEIHPVRQDTNPLIHYRYITGLIAPC